MSKAKQAPVAAVQEVIGLLRKLPPKVLLLLLIAGAAVVGVIFLLSLSAAPAKAPAGTYLFCSWNVENFFDDEDDPQNDDHLENWFAKHPEKFRLKVERLTDALLLMNDGRGPDIVVMYEVESEKCMYALKDALNERLTRANLTNAKYEHVLFLGDKLGRHFAPGILTRLPVDGNRTRKVTNYRGNGRTIEGHLTANGHDLAILAAHWTSRVDHGGKHADEHANAERRLSYARDCYGRFKAILTANPDADVILCGDFNDEFNDPSLRDGLHASGSSDDVRNALDEPRPLDLFAAWPASANPPGTIYGKGHWSIFDHICVSRGLLDDKGWSCDPQSASIFAPKELRRPGKKGEPFRFGGANDAEHGYSDHFPVTVRLGLKQ